MVATPIKTEQAFLTVNVLYDKLMLKHGGKLSLNTLGSVMVPIDEHQGFISQKEGRLMKYNIGESNKISGTPLHFEKGRFDHQP